MSPRKDILSASEFSGGNCRVINMYHSTLMRKKGFLGLNKNSKAYYSLSTNRLSTFQTLDLAGHARILNLITKLSL